MNLSTLNFNHPECGALCDPERELLFFLAYRPYCGFYDLKGYLHSIGIPINRDMLAAIIKGQIGIGTIREISITVSSFRITERGKELVQAMEAGGW